MANIIVFCILAIVILGSAVVCVTTRRIMRAATFLLFVLLGVAGLYFILDYTFLGAAQISVYAGGITMIYIFAIQLVNKDTLQGVAEEPNINKLVFGALLSVVCLGVVVVIFLKNRFIDKSMQLADIETSMSEIGHTLMGADKYQYVLPFEFISVFLLACIIGGIVISRKR